MDITTIVGLVLAIIGLVGAMIFKGVSLMVLLNPAAILLIVVGTMGAVINAFPKNDAKNIPKLFKKIFFEDKDKISQEECIKTLVEFSQIARREGLLVIESKLTNVNIPFLKRGLSLMLLGLTPDELEDILLEDIGAMEKRHSANAQVFTQAGTYAPTLGVLGAVVGLIAALSHMEDQTALGLAISAAFVATLYGIFTGYVLLHPFANKLKRKSQEEVLTYYILLSGIKAIANGDAPTVVEEKMLSFLPDNEKEKLGTKG